MHNPDRAPIRRKGTILPGERLIEHSIELLQRLAARNAHLRFTQTQHATRLEHAEALSDELRPRDHREDANDETRVNQIKARLSEGKRDTIFITSKRAL